MQYIFIYMYIYICLYICIYMYIYNLYISIYIYIYLYIYWKKRSYIFFGFNLLYARIRTHMSLSYPVVWWQEVPGSAVCAGRPWAALHPRAALQLHSRQRRQHHDWQCAQTKCVHHGVTRYIGMNSKTNRNNKRNREM